jgi:dihydrodipicolinate synthase/N-acetylneuraminate lyase
MIGGSGALSAISAIAPNLVRQVYDLCRKEQYIDARKAQEHIAALRHLLKSPRFETGLKAALRVMGRDCGQPRQARARAKIRRASGLQAGSRDPAR